MIEDIRQRDREAIPRFGPDKDPLLRAEMDRRWLLNNMYTREQVGEYQAREARLISEPLRRQVADLQRQLAEAVGQAEAAKQAAREIMAERNTWARQLADAMDERQTALDEVDKARELASIASNDRDSLHIAVEELAQDYTNNKHAVYHRGDSVARDICRVIARWETT